MTGLFLQRFASAGQSAQCQYPVGSGHARQAPSLMWLDLVHKRFGVHLVTVPPKYWSSLNEKVWAFDILLAVGSALSRLSILLFYQRIFSKNQGTRRASSIAGIFTILHFVALVSRILDPRIILHLTEPSYLSSLRYVWLASPFMASGISQ